MPAWLAFAPAVRSAVSAGSETRKIGKLKLLSLSDRPLGFHGYCVLGYSPKAPFGSSSADEYAVGVAHDRPLVASRRRGSAKTTPLHAARRS